MNPNNINIGEIDIDELIFDLYTKKPEKNIAYNIVPSNIDLENINNKELIKSTFEILLNIYMEGITRISMLNKILNNVEIDNFNYDDINVYNINLESLNYLNPWFNSLGFKLDIKEFEEKQFNIKNHYCRIILKSNPHDHTYFIYKKIDLPYHFLINGSSGIIREKSDAFLSNGDNKKEITKITEMYAIFQKPKNYKIKKDTDKIYTISFIPF
jgi:hypothetical protein